MLAKSEEVQLGVPHYSWLKRMRRMVALVLAFGASGVAACELKKLRHRVNQQSSMP